MKLSIIGSSSAGNAYLLQSDEGETLLIECGVAFKKIKQALNFKLGNVSCIVSHSHGDHACAIKDVLNAGIKVYASEATLKEKNVYDHHRAWIMEAGVVYYVGSFKVKPFNVNHDVQTFGFIISHPECGLTLFLTDTFYCDYKFPGLNNIIVECNHDVEIVESNGTPAFLRDRIYKSHMNLKTCKDLLQANDLTQLNNIVLIHLSDNNSNATQFQKEISELTGKNVHVADEGIVIEDFNKQPF